MEETPASTPTISFLALKRARRTVQDFVESYFTYAEQQQQDFWKYLDVLIYVEGTIYQMDEENEALARKGEALGDRQLKGQTILYDVLGAKQLLDARLTEQLQQGQLYWKMERLLGSHMTSCSNEPCQFSLEDVLTTSAAKSFDYRVLHLLLLKLTGQPYNDTLFQFLLLDEQLVDIGDDLVDYEDDVLKNSFNILRGTFGTAVITFSQTPTVSYEGDNGPDKVKLISNLERSHAQLAYKLPAQFRDHHRARHLQASAIPGSESWVFPKLILDEAAFRQQYSGSIDEDVSD